MTQTVLITGGAGFIGSHVCKALARAGHRPVVVDNLEHGHRSAVRWGPLVTADLSDRDAMRAVFRRHAPASVVHLAGYIAAGESVADPGKYYGNNLRGTLTLLEVMREAAVRRIVFSSSAAVYGVPESIPIRETARLGPVNPYGHTKLMCEQMLHDQAVHGLSSVSLRYFNAAGADPDGELGEQHEPETHLIPLVLEAAMGIRPHIDVYGTDYLTPDGTCIRDYIHVSDLAEAHVLALAALDRTTGAMFCNLGNGKGFSVFEVIAAAEAVTGRRVPRRHRDRRPGDPPVLVADDGRARRDLGWRPAYADLQVQIGHAWAWQMRTARHRDAVATN